MINGKVWGKTQEIFENNLFGFHRVKIEKDGFCSKHKHQSKYNGFFVERGKLKIEVWKNDYDLVDTTILGPQQNTVVKPGEFHRFTALEETVAYEYYWVELEGNDIVRDDVGGVSAFQPKKREMGKL